MWNYKINIKDLWEKYKANDHETYDTNKELFTTMKTELTEAIKKQVKSGDYLEMQPILKKLKSAKHLSSFNKAWNDLYDYCDYKRIWLATNF